jgi:acetylglutamate kinase
MVGVRTVLVHGGGPELSEMMQRLGKKPVFIDGLRVTDKETIDIAQMVLAGRINKSLVNLLQEKGGMAVGLSGMDARLIEAKIRDEKYGYVGDVTNVNTKLIDDLLDNGYIPVISTLGCDEEGNTYNINGDTAAGRIAQAMKADRLIMMTDIRGVMHDPSDPDTLVSELDVVTAEKMMENGEIYGGMIPKIRCCIDAVSNGVSGVTILDGTISHAVLIEILTDEGAGTMVYRR